MDNTNTSNNDNQSTVQTDETPFASTMKAGMDKLFNGMKMSIVALIVALTTLVGCKTLPTPPQIGSSARLIGTSTGLVVNAMGVKDETKKQVLDILNTVCSAIPSSTETFVKVWVPLAKVEIDKLVEKGEMDAAEGDMVLTAFTLVCKGVDYIFEVRYPKAKAYRELVEAAVDGFTQGFASAVNPYALKANSVEMEYDVEAYEYLKASIEQ